MSRQEPKVGINTGSKVWYNEITLSISAGTTASYTIPKNLSIQKIHMRLPSMTTATTTTLTFLTNNYEIYNSGAKSVNANYTMHFDDILYVNDIIKVTLDASDTADITLVIYALELE